MSTSRLQLSLNAKGLSNLAGLRILNTSDPFAVVTVRGDSPNNPPVIVGQTEVAYNSLNPHWSTVIFLDDYKFGVPYYIEVGVFDFSAKKVGKSESELAKQSSETGLLITATESNRNLIRAGKLPHKIMGTALFDVGQIIGSKGNVASKSLQTGGVLYAHIERSRLDGTFGFLHLQLRGISLKNLRLMGRKSSPFFELLRKVDSPNGAIWISVYRSNVVKGNLNPKWEATRLPLDAVCNGDMKRAMKVVVMDYNSRFGTHSIIGEFETTMQRFIDCKNDGGDIDEDAAFKLRRGDSIVGHVLVLRATTILLPGSEGPEPKPEPKTVPSESARRPEFLDYLQGGCQISLAVAIDFSASNGNPIQEGTPHYIYPSSSKILNGYERAIFAVGAVLARYDNDGMIPTWGFGAKRGSKVLRCFQCGNEVEVNGVHEVLDAYRGVFEKSLIMSSPTDLIEVITTASRYAQSEKERAEQVGDLSYTILLIFTAGKIQNVEETKQVLVEASDSPLSLVIVGIGDHDFRYMKRLEKYDPGEGGRDITTFVCFDEYQDLQSLTQAVLCKIPDQLVDFFYERGVMPGQAVGIDQETVAIMSADDDDRTVNFLG